MFTTALSTASNFFARTAFVVMPKTSRKPATPQLQFSYPLPYGAVIRDGGVQFVVYSRSATAMRVLLYRHVSDREPTRLIEYNPATDRWGDIWSVFVPGIKPGQVDKVIAQPRYGQRRRFIPQAPEEQGVIHAAVLHQLQ